MTHAAGDEPVSRRRKRDPVPTLPRRVVAAVAGRAVAEISFDTGGLIAPGSVLWLCDPLGVSGPDRERAAAQVVKLAGLDVKEDFERVYDALWSQAPNRR